MAKILKLVCSFQTKVVSFSYQAPHNSDNSLFKLQFVSITSRYHLIDFLNRYFCSGSLGVSEETQITLPNQATYIFPKYLPYITDSSPLYNPAARHRRLHFYLYCTLNNAIFTRTFATTLKRTNSISRSRRSP